MDAGAGLSIAGLRKSFGSNQVLKGVDLGFEAGEVHALLGANGAGKSTLLGCLSGATTPDEGLISVDGTVHSGFTPREAFDAGIAIIYQHFQLIGPLTVADNIFLGRERRTKWGTVDRRRQNAETTEVLTSLGIEINPAAAVELLSVGQQQMVEIGRAVRLRPRVLILDEPTAALGDHEVRALLDLVRRLAHEQHIAVIYVTHLLGEVLEVADRTTVLRDGQVLWTRDRADVTLSMLANAISPDAASRTARPRTRAGSPVLELDGFSSSFTGPVDLTVHAGEVVGIFGLLGSGRTDLLETLAGVRRTAGGQVRIDGKPVELRTPRSAQAAGLSLVASDRKDQSLFGDMSALENLLMPHFSALAAGIRRPGRESAIFKDTASAVGLVPARAEQAADAFSGGNAQKIAVARWVCEVSRTRCLLLDEPTQGVDVGARHDLYEVIRRFAEQQSVAILFATNDPEEIIALADRVLVLVDRQQHHLGLADLDESSLTSLAQPRLTADHLERSA